MTLPFSKVLEQFTKLQVRADQSNDPAVPQVETPFLQVTLEDDARFGTATAPFEIAELPSVKVHPATAETIAAAEPEPAAKQKFSLSPAPTAPDKSKDSDAGKNSPPAAAAAPAPTRIPFKLSPNGTDVPAPERVPASSGPSVPTSAPEASAAPAAPTRIPFKLGATSDGAKSKGEPWVTKEGLAASMTDEPDQPAPAAPASPVSLAATISLPLRPILQQVLPLQLTADVSGVPADAQIVIPFKLIQPQLASGRISLTPDDFARHLPEAHRSLFKADDTAAAVVLPLQDVLKNLPGALQMRTDQVEQELGEQFETPFSAKAEEDAQRFRMPPPPLPPVAPALPGAAVPAVKVAPAPVKFVLPPAEKAEPVEVAPVAEKLAAPAPVAAPDEPETPDAKSVVESMNKLTGVEACAVIFSDGLNLAGSLPEKYGAEGLCAMAPSFLQRADEHLGEAKLGTFQAMTFSCSDAAVTFFKHNNLCLVALHRSETALTSEVRDRLSEAVQQLSRKYSQAA